MILLIRNDCTKVFLNITRIREEIYSMIAKENFHVLNYVKKEEYSGSFDGMRYMLKRCDDEILVTIWPEPYALAYTSEDLKIKKTFPLTSDGVSDICDYLNMQSEALSELWRSHSSTH